MTTSVETASSDPLARLAAVDSPWAIRRNSGDSGYLAFLDFEEILELDADQPEASLKELLAPRSSNGLSFSGWTGFFSYEFLSALSGLRCQAKRDLKTPGGWFARPHSILHINHDGIEVESTSSSRKNELNEMLTSVPPLPDATEMNDFLEPICNLDFEAYRQVFLQAREEILDGNVYQIKISQRYETEASVDPLLAFRKLEAANPSPESFLLQTDDFSIVSCSPETVLQKKGDQLITRPIGGTCERLAEEAMDEAVDAFLRNVKELREHNMLVDLERNDLSTVCLPGSVKIARFREVETYAHLHHLVSTIEGRLRPDVSIRDVLGATLPGGTITGCPKFRAMELIDEYEPCFRGLYTGSFGTIEDNGDLRFNLIIRAIVMLGNRCYTQAGGGIVVDSTPEYERNENQIKARALLDVLR
ncbi:MAG: anthranilate synthase component I family protein [Opitutales bacterium]